MYYMRAHKPLPSLDLLKQKYDYNSETGELISKRTGKALKGVNSNGYITVSIKNKTYVASRICYYIHTGEDPRDLVVDHIDQDRTNNRFENLRLLPYHLNSSNVRQFSGFSYDRNPRRHKSPYHMTLFHEGKRIVSKYYPCPLLARLAYVEAVRTHKGIILPV